MICCHFHPYLWASIFYNRGQVVLESILQQPPKKERYDTCSLSQIYVATQFSVFVFQFLLFISFPVLTQFVNGSLFRLPGEGNSSGELNKKTSFVYPFIAMWVYICLFNFQISAAKPGKYLISIQCYQIFISFVSDQYNTIKCAI